MNEGEDKFTNVSGEGAQAEPEAEKKPEHPGRIKGRFAPGVSGNPGGKPLRAFSRAQFMAILRGVMTDSVIAKVIERARDQALAGNRDAREWLFNYLAGAPTQSHDVSVRSASQVKVEVVYDGMGDAGDEGEEVGGDG